MKCPLSNFGGFFSLEPEGRVVELEEIGEDDAQYERVWKDEVLVLKDQYQMTE